MKPNYKNWVPLGMIAGFLCAAGVSVLLLVLVLLTDWPGGSFRTAAVVILSLLSAVLVAANVFFINLYRTFSYNGKKQFARRIIEKVSDYIILPENGRGLDVGCGSGALTIACARKNPQGAMVGLDRWGKEYASFSQKLCQDNARAEGVADRTSFCRGDACKLDFPDESFDAVTSNYCYHNIPSLDRQAIILESLRVLKKGGVFAIHDEFSTGKYGDVSKLLKKLQDMGYEKAEILDTAGGLFMTSKEASLLGLRSSALLVGKK